VSRLEEVEKLEQLRVLSMGRAIHVGIVEQAASGVDTLADYERFVRQYRQARQLQAA
jgi:CMP-2-keto-3-deoxyoctulosonic acid synthetase